MVGTLAVLACGAYLILCSALAGSCVGGLGIVTRMRECMCGGAVFVVLADFIDRLYRQLCYEISANGNPGVIQSAWLWCKYSRVYNAFINAIVWLHLINAFLEAPLTYSSASSAGRVINIVVAVILLVHGSMSLYWRRQLDGKVSMRVCALLCIAAVYLADAIVVLSTGYTTGTAQMPTRLPYSIVLRPIMVLLVMGPAQQTLFDVGVATFRSRQVFLLAGAVYAVAIVVILSLAATNVTAAQEEVAATSGFGFGSFTSTILTMFNFVFSGENFGSGSLTFASCRCHFGR